MSRWRLISADDPREWDAAVERCQPYDTYHLAAYHHVAAEQGEGEPWLLAFSTGGTTVAAMPFLRREIAGGADATSVYGYAGPVVADGHDAHSIRSEFSDVLRQGFDSLGIISVFSRLHPLLENHLLLPQEAIVSAGETVAIDLRRPSAELDGETEPDQLRRFRKAIREGLELRMDEGFSRLSDFVELYYETMRRAGAGDNYYFPESYFKSLVTALPTRVHLAVAEREGVLVGATMILVADGTIQYHLSATAAEFTSLSPSACLLLFVRQWGAAHGLRWFHLGGGVGGKTDSLYRFKGKFSCGRGTFRTLQWVVDELAYKRMVEAHLLTARQAGAKLDERYFPSYRAPFEFSEEDVP